MKARTKVQKAHSTEEIQQAADLVQSALGDQEQRLIDLLRGLPMAETPAGSIPYQTTIPGIVHELMCLAGRDRIPLSRTKRAAGVGEVLKALRKIVEVPLSPDPDGPGWARYFSDDINMRLVVLRCAAIQLADDIEQDAQRIAPSKRGQPAKEKAKALEDRLRYHYENLTGKRAAAKNEWPDVRDGGRLAHGEYYEFVRDAFAILGVEASADTRIKQARAKTRNTRKSGQ